MLFRYVPARGKKSTKNQNQKENQYKFTQWQAAKYYWKEYNKVVPAQWALMIAVMTAKILTWRMPALLMAGLISRLQSGEDLNWQRTILMAVILSISGEVIAKIVWYFANKTQSYAIKNIIDDGFKNLMGKSLKFHSDNFAGSSVNKVSRLAERSERFHDVIMENIPDFLSTLLFALFVIGPEGWPAIALLMTIFMIFWLAVSPLLRACDAVMTKRFGLESERTGAFIDTVTNIAAVKAYSSESLEDSRFAKISTKARKATYDGWQFWNVRINSATSIFYAAIAFGPLAFLLSREGVSDPGRVFLLFYVLDMLSSRVWGLNNIWRGLNASLTAAAEGLELLAQPQGVVDADDATKLEVKKGKASIDFKGMSFAYEPGTSGEGSDDSDEVKTKESKSPESSKVRGYTAQGNIDNHANDQTTQNKTSSSDPTLLYSDFNLAIKPGEKVGLVGPSGGGKTTLVKLLLRFMDVDSGSINIAGQNIAKVTQESLRSAISYIPQEPALFHRTLKENILYGNPGATDEDMIKAAKKAHAHDFIAALPEGYDTLVGERGIKLSGGQRQRVAIARAFLKDSQILVLDEATSALDSESEQLIQDSLAKLMQNKTVISIAHRLSTLQIMDQLVVIEDGQITQQGTHAELTKAKGTYARLWAHQSGSEFLQE